MSDRAAWIAERWVEANSVRDDYLARLPTPRDAWESGARWGWAAGLGFNSVGLPERPGEYGVRVMTPKGGATGFTLRDTGAKLSVLLRELATRVEQDEREDERNA